MRESSLNLVRNFKQMGSEILQVGLAVGRPIFSKEFLKDKKDSDLICTRSLFHSKVVCRK